MVQVYGEDRRETPTSENGNKGGLKAMVCILGQMEIGMRESFATV